MIKFLRGVAFLCTVAFATVFAEPTVVLFNDTSAWYHWGCTGTSLALKEEIRKTGFEIQSFPINVTYSLQEVPSFEEFDAVSSFEKFKTANPDVVHAIEKSDAVVITGEGTIHDLRAGPRSLLYLAYISKKQFQKHVEIINHSAYPKDDPSLLGNFLNNFKVETDLEDHELKLAQRIYKQVYKELDFVAIREKLSQDEMQKIGISSTLSFDCLPLYIRDNYHTSKNVTKTVVVAGSAAHTESGVKKLCAYLDDLAAQGYEIKVLTGAAAYPSRDDAAFISHLQKYTIIDAKSMDEWLDTINNASFLVSGRFHHSIAAFCLNTPFIALNSNTHKVHAICQMMDVPAPLLYDDPDLVSQLKARTEALSPLNNATKVEELCTLALNNFHGLRSLKQ